MLRVCTAAVYSPVNSKETEQQSWGTPKWAPSPRLDTCFATPLIRQRCTPPTPPEISPRCECVYGPICKYFVVSSLWSAGVHVGNSGMGPWRLDAGNNLASSLLPGLTRRSDTQPAYSCNPASRPVCIKRANSTTANFGGLSHSSCATNNAHWHSEPEENGVIIVSSNQLIMYSFIQHLLHHGFDRTTKDTKERSPHMGRFTAESANKTHSCV